MWNFGAVLRSFSHLHRRSGGLVLFQLPRDLVFKTTSSKFCASTSQEKSPALQKAEETQNPLNLWGHWFIEVDTRTKKHVGWWWLMMVDDGWWWLMTVDDGWWWLMMVDDGWWWLMMVDDAWDCINDDICILLVNSRLHLLVWSHKCGVVLAVASGCLKGNLQQTINTFSQRTYNIPSGKLT